MAVMEEDEIWSVPANALPIDYIQYDNTAIVSQLSTSDASSTRTDTSDSTVIDSGDTSTPHTTPGIDCDETMNRTDPVAINSQEAVGFDQGGFGLEITSTRRRSARISRATLTRQEHSANDQITRLNDLKRLDQVSSYNLSSLATISKKIRLPQQNSNANETDASARRSQKNRTQAIKAQSEIDRCTPITVLKKRSYQAMLIGPSNIQQKLDHSARKKVKVEDNSEVEDFLKAVPDLDLKIETRHGTRPRKFWIESGLFVGVEQDCNLNVVIPSRLPARGKSRIQKRPSNPLPLPISKVLETERCFKMPYFVWAPNPYHVGTIPGWRKLNHNVFIGDAFSYWKKENSSNVKCICTTQCNDDCLNRCTWMECDDESCSVGRNCKNRAFADLRDRVKKVKQGKDFARGVDVFLTADRGYGLRATRSFEPRQIIVEYTGEIITQEESERRMDEVYNDNQNYYLMLFDQNMILDATRGSVARFVNHSCEPNARMEKWLVEGKPRMALFAGDDGVNAGDELTYDYNFNWFKGVTQQSCKCGSNKCRGTLGKRTDAPRPKASSPSSNGLGTRSKKAKPNNKRPHTKLENTNDGEGATAKRKIEAQNSPNRPYPLAIGEKHLGQPSNVPPGRSITKPMPPAHDWQFVPSQRDPSERSTCPSISHQSSTIDESVLRHTFPVKRESPEFPELSSMESTSGESGDEEVKPVLQRLTHSLMTFSRKRPRITRTYRVNKTILPTKETIMNKDCLNAARDLALEQVLSEAAEVKAVRENDGAFSMSTLERLETNETMNARGIAIKTLLNNVSGSVAAVLGKSVSAAA